MKLIDRFPVEGTRPVIYIGHRTYTQPDGGEGVSRTWYAEYNLGGKTYHEPLREKTKSLAIRAANRITERLERGEQRVMVKKVEWVELRDRYIEYVTNRNRGPRTLEKYRFGLKSLLDFAQIEKIANPAKFTPEQFWKFSTYLRTSGNEPKTVYDRLMFVKQVFKWAQGKAKVLTENQLEAEAPDKPPAAEQPCFSAAQIRELLAKASVSDGPVFALLAYTGMRIGEARDLRWTDIHFDRGQCGQFFVRRGGSRTTTKGKANRIIPVHPEFQKILATLPRRGENVFYEPVDAVRDPKVNVPLVERKLLARLKRLCKTCKFDRPEQYMLHTFRHAFASMCAMQNTSYKYALEWMGHKSSDILDMYYKMYDDVADKAMAAISFALPNSSRAA